MSELDHAVALAPSDAEVRRARGLELLEDAKYALARDDLRLARKLAPNDPRHTEALAMAVRLLWKTRNSDPGLEQELDALIAELHQHATTASQWDLLAQLLLELRHNLNGARRFAERSARLEPGCASCFNTLASACAARGDLSAAIRYQTRAIGLLSEHQSAEPWQRNLSRLRSRLAEETAAESASPAAPP